MTVAPGDGCCRACGGPLQIIHADDATMTVACDDCGDTYAVEPDAFGDGCMIYYLPFITRPRAPDEAADPDPS